MVTRTAALRLQLIDSVTGPARGVSSSLGGIDRAMARLGKNSSPEVRRLSKELEYLKRKSDAIKNFRMSRTGFKDMSTDLKAAQSNLARLQQAMKSATAPTAKMKSDLASAKVAVKAASQAFREQGAAVRAAEGALKTYGITSRTAISSSQKQIRKDIADTIREMRRLEAEARKPKSKPDAREKTAQQSTTARDALVTAGGYITANQASRFGGRAFGLAVDFNEAAEYQAALGGLNTKERDDLNKQAQKIGGDTRFSNVDVIRAQTSVMQGGIRNVQTILAMMQPITDYALAMGVSLEEAAETVKGAAQSKRVDLQKPEKISGFIDYLVQMAKHSGMSDEDVRQYLKYGGSPLTGIQMPDDYSAAIGMILRRSGIRGDEAGVFARSAASKLVAPTNKGRSALAAMGIDYDSFVKMPDALSLKGLETVIRSEFGKKLSDEMREKIKDVLENGTFTDDNGDEQPIAADRGQFVSAISEIISPMFADKKGKVAAKDATAIADALGTFQKNSADSVDVVGLFNAIFSRNPSQAQLNAMFTDRQGGRAKNIASRWDEFQGALDVMRNVKPGLANDIGTKANQGLFGDWTKLTGTVETAMTKIGQDWEFALRPMINLANDVVDGFNALSPATRRLVEAVIAAAVTIGGIAATRAAGNLLRGVLGGAAGGATVAGSTTAATTTAASAASRFLPWLSRLSLPLTAGMVTYNALSDIPTQGYQSAQKQNPNLLQDLERMKRIRSEFKGGFEGGRHAAYAGVAPLPNGGKFAGDINEAKRAGEQIEQSLNVTARPEVDTSSLQRALSLARSVGNAIRSIGGMSTPTSTTPANSTKFGGPRAKGGPVKRGQTYLTGEEGMELFTPGADGHITPNSQIAARPGGGMTIHQTNHFYIGGKASKDDGAEVVRALDRQVNRSRETAFSGLKFAGDT